jgi:glucokinase
MIGIDLGGTRIKGVVVNPNGEVIFQALTNTLDDKSGSWKHAIKETVQKLQKHSNDALVGISAPGLPDDSHSCIAYMPGRLDGLENLIWSDYLNIPCKILNDGVAALVAEAKVGAAKGNKNVVMLTLGTGVGGAILLNGMPYGGHFNKAGHFGHMVINHNGDKDVTNMPGSLEECIGNCTIEKRSMGKYTSTAQMIEAMRNGDSFAKQIWLNSVRHLGLGLASIANMFSPEIIVLGGGIVEAGDDLFLPLADFMDEYEWRPGGSQQKIVKAHCGEYAGAIGAAIFANQNDH